MRAELIVCKYPTFPRHPSHRTEKYILMLTIPALRIARTGLCLLISPAFCTFLNAQVDFNRQVRPILAEYCFQCHGPDAEKRSADLRLDVEVEAKKSAAWRHESGAYRDGHRCHGRGQ